MKYIFSNDIEMISECSPLAFKKGFLQTETLPLHFEGHLFASLSPSWLQHTLKNFSRIKWHAIYKKNKRLKKPCSMHNLSIAVQR